MEMYIYNQFKIVSQNYNGFTQNLSQLLTNATIHFSVRKNVILNLI